MRILVVEDDANLSRQVATALGAAGYAVDLACDGEEGHFLGDTENYDAVVLDLGLPRMDGVSVLRNWRAAGRRMPVLVLTARDSWTEKVDVFDSGADDYVTKPFRMEELLARLRAMIRRTAGHATALIECPPVCVDTRTGKVTVSGALVPVTAQEYKVIAYLMHHKDRIVSRSELTEHIYAQDGDRDSNTIEVFIGRLRRKLGVDVIRTVRGRGYRLVPQNFKD